MLPIWASTVGPEGNLMQHNRVKENIISSHIQNTLINPLMIAGKASPASFGKLVDVFSTDKCSVQRTCIPTDVLQRGEVCMMAMFWIVQ